METKKVTFASAVKSGWKNCFNYSGRASRKEFWIFSAFNVFLFFIVAIIAPRLIVFLHIQPLQLHRLVAITVYLISLGLLLPVASLIVRRLHDSDKNGWLSLIVHIPTLGLAITPIVFVITKQPIEAVVSLETSLLIPALAAIIVLCSLKGSEGPNGYGADPNIATEQ